MSRSGVRYRRRSGGVPGNPYREMERRLQQTLIANLNEAAENAEREGIKRIMSSGTNRAWSVLSPLGRYGDGAVERVGGSGASRFATGEMAKAFTSRVTAGGKNPQVSVGWIFNWKDYFMIQDLGFSKGGFRPGVMVEGMGVMAYMDKYLDQQVDQAIDKTLEEITRGV